MQLLFGIRVDDVEGSCCHSLVHAHIQVAFKTEGKSSFSLVELMAADTKVSKDAIDGSSLMQTEETAQMPEIMGQKGDPFVFRQVTTGVAVLVEGEQFAF